MAENSNIEWTHHTFNPWMGCTKVTAGCKHCYAEAMMDTRLGKVQWGPQGTRVVTSRANWQLLLKWDRAAAKAGEKHRVFCASLADVFEDNRVVVDPDGLFNDLDSVRQALWILIESTPNLIWLLLTKRPENIRGMVPPSWLERWPENVWTGTSPCDQETADLLVPRLLEVPGQHFLSCEPLLGAVDFNRFFGLQPGKVWADCLCDEIDPSDKPCLVCECKKSMNPIDWVICGGESGPGARPMHPDWARGLRDQCVAAGVPFFFKQWGEFAPFDPERELPMRVNDFIDLLEKKGGGRYNAAEAWCPGNLICEPGGITLLRKGKKAAGRMLDGVEHNELPAAFGVEAAV